MQSRRISVSVFNKYQSILSILYSSQLTLSHFRYDWDFEVTNTNLFHLHSFPVTISHLDLLISNAKLFYPHSFPITVSHSDFGIRNTNLFLRGSSPTMILHLDFYLTNTIPISPGLSNSMIYIRMRVPFHLHLIIFFNKSISILPTTV